MPLLSRNHLRAGIQPEELQCGTHLVDKSADIFDATCHFPLKSPESGCGYHQLGGIFKSVITSKFSF
jgi:hypothetical protein